MREINIKQTCELLNQIMECELAGVIRYTHYSLMVSGPHRIPIVDFMKAQASESLMHAQQAEETHQHDLMTILKESLAHESEALRLYKELLDEVENGSIYLEEFARTMIGQEELHSMELKKMLRDYEK